MAKKIHSIYSERLTLFMNEHEKLIKQNRFVSIGRLLLFLLAIGLIIFFWSLGINVIISISGIMIIPFLFLIQLNVKLSHKIRHLKELININQNEIEALNGNISVFPSGTEFTNPEHPYSYDMDIFGQESIYQAINRTSTAGGSIFLANALKTPLLESQKITERQEAIKELSEKLDWRQNFHATGNVVLENETDNSSNSPWFRATKKNYSNDSNFHDEILTWLNEPFYFINNKALKYFLILLPAISIILFGLLLAGLFPFMGFVLIGLIQLFVVGLFVKKTSQIHRQIGRKVELLDKYEKMILCIEKHDFTSKYLNMQKSILGYSTAIASEELKRLKKLARLLDNRMNILFAFFANAFLLWDLQIVSRMEKWREQNTKSLPQWLNVNYEFDFLSSLAGFAFNNPDYCVPEIKNGNFYLEIEQGGHPLIKDNVRVNNDLIIDGYSQLLVITGANMAGKSTFLRTIGVNMILACAGSVVCAKNLVISPIYLHTSVRTSDSVQKNESYFYAELKRLKSIIDRMQAGERLFVIIDEMLRGTNSKDKHHGSEALIEQLIRLNASGLIATHDIGLGTLAKKYPDNVKNYRFEVEIENNELEFDYKLKTGVSQNLNATFLMKKMGITV